MRKIIILLLAVLLLLSGCAQKETSLQKDESETDIYATIAPLFALTEAVVQDAENVVLHSLLEPHEMCIRSVELTDRELALLYASADIVVSAGNELEASQATLEQLAEEQFPLIEISEGLELLVGESETDAENSHFSGINPHFYMSAEKTVNAVYTIGASLAVLDDKNADLYAVNAKNAATVLDGAHDDIKAAVNAYTNVPVLIMNEALVYCADEYGLTDTAICERETAENITNTELLRTYADKGYHIAFVERQAPDLLLEMLEDSGIKAVRMNIFSDEIGSLSFTDYINALKYNAALFAAACDELRK